MRRLFFTLFLFTSSALVAAEPKPSAADYELRGFFGKDTSTEISLRRAGTEQSRWYRLGEKSDGILVEKADAKTGIATITVNGVRRTLRLVGEGARTPEEKRRELHRQYGRAMSAHIKKWNPEQIATMNKVFQDAGASLFREHPEYFNESGFNTPEAKAALLAIARKGILAGATTSGVNGAGALPPENMNGLIEKLCSNISIKLNQGSPENSDETKAMSAMLGKPVSRYTAVTVDDSAPVQFIGSHPGDDTEFVGNTVVLAINDAMQWSHPELSIANQK